MIIILVLEQPDLQDVPGLSYPLRINAMTYEIDSFAAVLD